MASLRIDLMYSPGTCHIHKEFGKISNKALFGTGLKKWLYLYFTVILSSSDAELFIELGKITNKRKKEKKITDFFRAKGCEYTVVRQNPDKEIIGNRLLSMFITDKSPSDLR